VGPQNVAERKKNSSFKKPISNKEQ
jgi:hypothetical protein